MNDRKLDPVVDWPALKSPRGRWVWADTPTKIMWVAENDPVVKDTVPKPCEALYSEQLSRIASLLVYLGVHIDGETDQAIIAGLEAFISKREAELKAEAVRHAADRASPPPVRRSNKPAGSRW